MSTELDITASEQLRLASRGYKVLKKLGEGTYATVYLMQYINPKSSKMLSLACKVMDTNKIAAEFVKKFLPRELDILKKISHPHIIQIQNIFQRKSKFFIFMRYAENGDLLEFILKRGALSEPQARIWFRQISLAVQYLHEMDIAHRDLKCENIFITANFNIKLADFSFARYSIDSQGKRIISDTYCGSISYASPEILRGIPYQPKIADMWSLGVILYIILNKAMPFDDRNIKRLCDQQSNKRWRFRAKVKHLLSDECKILTACLLEPDIVKRWNAQQVVNSEWMTMDARLAKLTRSEEEALDNAKEFRRKRYEAISRRSSTSSGTSRTSNVSVRSKVSEVGALDLTTKVFDYSKQCDSVEDLTVGTENQHRESSTAVECQNLLVEPKKS